MKLELRNDKDFWAGLMFLGTGIGAMFVARDYPFGTTLRMGPGYFPMVLSGLLVLKQMVFLGADPVGGTPEDYKKFIGSEFKKWQVVVKDSGATAQ